MSGRKGRRQVEAPSYSTSGVPKLIQSPKPQLGQERWQPCEIKLTFCNKDGFSSRLGDLAIWDCLGSVGERRGWPGAIGPHLQFSCRAALESPCGLTATDVAPHHTKPWTLNNLQPESDNRGHGSNAAWPFRAVPDEGRAPHAHNSGVQAT